MTITLRTIRRPEVLRKTGFSATTLFNLERKGEFPKHAMLTPRCAVWLETEVDAWLRNRLANPAKPAAAPERRARAAGAAA